MGNDPESRQRSQRTLGTVGDLSIRARRPRYRSETNCSEGSAAFGAPRVRHNAVASPFEYFATGIPVQHRAGILAQSLRRGLLDADAIHLDAALARKLCS